MQVLDETLQAAILNARAASLNAEIAAMQAENQHRLSCGSSVAYGYDEFQAAIANNGLGEDNLINFITTGEL